jgi:disulfide bond formation protein DsbB
MKGAMRDTVKEKEHDPLMLAAATVAVIGAATLGGAWFFQYVLDIRPCPLCLEQRYAYYLVIPLAALIAFARPRGLGITPATIGLAIVVLATLANAVLGTYHSGVEWGWWPGPTDCAGAPNLGSGGSLLDRIDSIKVVRCDEVQWRFLGLSLAGYNVLISLAMAVVAVVGIVRARAAR